MEMVVTATGADRIEASFEGLTVATAQDGTSPSPFFLFLAAIGTCVGIYVVRFCQQRGISIEGLRIRQRTTDDPTTGLVRRIDLEIELPPTFPARYAEAVVRAAQLCRVKKHLEHPPEIDVRALARAAESSART